MTRVSLFLGCLLALELMCAGRAWSYAEYCPASVAGWAVPGATPAPAASHAPSALYSFTLIAQGPRSVKGSVDVHTSAGWFSVPFPSTPLLEHQYKERDAYVAFTRKTWESDELFARFPQPVLIISSFVRDASATGDPYFGWDAKGDVTCGAPAGLEAKGGFPTPSPWAIPLGLTTENPRTDYYRLPAPGEAIALATPIAVPGSLDCPVPFTPARVVRAVSPVYPAFPTPYQRQGQRSVMVEVAVGSANEMDDAWVWISSGFREFDAAALKAARATEYASGTSFCQPANGLYLFRANFDS